jgi:hypothetical protein
VVLAYLGSLKMAALLQAGGAGRGGSTSRGGERDKQVDEGADDEAVHLLAVGPEVSPEHLLEPAPVVGTVAQHHLLHRPPEVAVQVGRLDGQRRGAAFFAFTMELVDSGSNRSRWVVDERRPWMITSSSSTATARRKKNRAGKDTRERRSAQLQLRIGWVFPRAKR